MVKKIFLSTVLFFISSCGGGPDLRNTVLATEAMERAREAQAPIYAVREYGIAKDLFDIMNEELNQEQYADANNTALLVIEAANEAIRVARLVKDNEK